MHDKGYIFWDSETANPQQRICQVAYVLTDFEGNRIDDPVYQAINPESEIAPWNRHHLRIDWSSLGDMPTFPQFCEETGLLGILSEYVLVAHNANGADIHHIRKSLGAYGIEMPEIEAADTMQIAQRHGLPSSLVKLCNRYGVELGEHHDALCDANACMGVYLKMSAEFGSLESAVWTPRPDSYRGHKHAYSGLGMDHDRVETIEQILKKAEDAGVRGYSSDIEDPVGLKVKVSGETQGYNRDEIIEALRSCGMDAKDGKPAKKTQFLAIGDNVGRTKLDVVFGGGTQAKIITTGEILEVMDRFTEVK